MDISNIKYKYSEKLPEVEIIEPNPRDAYILQGDYSGTNSETTAILTYTYQSYIVRPFDEDIAEVLENIAIVEMTHHKVLGDLIVSLGGDPIYAYQGRFWTGKNVCYNKNLKEMLVHNIASEEEAIRGYLASIDKICSETAIGLLEAIIEDERLHIKAFKEILEYITFWK